MDNAHPQILALHLDANLLGDPVRRRLARAVRHTRHGLLLRDGDAAHGARDQHELGLARGRLLLEQRPRSLEEADRRNGIDLEVGAEEGRIDGEHVLVEAAGAGSGVGDDDVDGRDACAGEELREGREGGCLGRVEGYEDEVAVGVRREGGEGLGGAVGDVPGCGDDGGRGAQEERRCYLSPDACRSLSKRLTGRITNAGGQ